MWGGACLLLIMARLGLKVITGLLDSSFNFFFYIYHATKIFSRVSSAYQSGMHSTIVAYLFYIFICVFLSLFLYRTI